MSAPFWYVRSSPTSLPRETTVDELETMAQAGALTAESHLFHEVKTAGKWVPVAKFRKLAALMQSAIVATPLVNDEQEKDADDDLDTTRLAPNPSRRHLFRPYRFWGMTLVSIVLSLSMALYIVGAVVTVVFLAWNAPVFGIVSSFALIIVTIASTFVTLSLYSWMLAVLHLLIAVTNEAKRVADNLS